MGNSEYSKWIGKTQEKNDKLLPFPAQFMENTLNRDATLIEGKELPPLWHWLYFLESEKLSNLGRDGHPKKVGFTTGDLTEANVGRWTLLVKKPLLIGQDSLKKVNNLIYKRKGWELGTIMFCDSET